MYEEIRTWFESKSICERSRPIYYIIFLPFRPSTRVYGILSQTNQ